MNTYTRPGSAGITIGGILFHATRYTNDNAGKWHTGISADIGPWKRKNNRHRSWFIDASLLGYGVGVCR